MPARTMFNCQLKKSRELCSLVLFALGVLLFSVRTYSQGPHSQPKAPVVTTPAAENSNVMEILLLILGLGLIVGAGLFIGLLIIKKGNKRGRSRRDRVNKNRLQSTQPDPAGEVEKFSHQQHIVRQTAALEQLAEDVKWLTTLYRVSAILAAIYFSFQLLSWFVIDLLMD